MAKVELATIVGTDSVQISDLAAAADYMAAAVHRAMLAALASQWGFRDIVGKAYHLAEGEKKDFPTSKNSISSRRNGR